MCQPKFWTKIIAQEIEETRHKCIISIEAERSDLETFNFRVELDGNDSLLAVHLR